MQILRSLKGLRIPSLVLWVLIKKVGNSKKLCALNEIQKIKNSLKTVNQ
jgi:hypothetical protein